MYYTTIKIGQIVKIDDVVFRLNKRNNGSIQLVLFTSHDIEKIDKEKAPKLYNQFLENEFNTFE